MLVARSYSYGNTIEEEKPKSAPKAQREYTKPFGWRPASYEEHAIQYAFRDQHRQGSRPNEIMEHKTEQAKTAPVDIPSRQHIQTRPTSKQSVARCTTSGAHDTTSMAPSVAALLAMTSIPVKKSFSPRQKRSSVSKTTRMSSEELMAEWRQSPVTATNTRRPSRPSESNLEILLSFPPQNDEPLSRSPGDECSEVDSYAPTRSPSCDSMPSLATDLDSRSFLSSWTNSSTPHSIRRRSSNSLSTGSRSKPSPKTLPIIFDVVEDPLSSSEPEIEIFDSSSSRSPSPSSTPIRRRPSRSSTTPKKSPKSRFTSNLTFSLLRLKGLATSTFSNFASPTTYLPEDHLSRGLFGSSGGTYYPSEMRPKPVAGLPDPAMRRYFNPPTHRSEGGSLHTHDWMVEAVDLDREAAVSTRAAEAGDIAAVRVVRLQNLSVESTTKPFVETKDVLSTGTDRSRTVLQQRQREPRENNEFLRICVLEMNMRRAGKLEDEEDKAAAMAMRRGRRAFWLPPRLPNRATAVTMQQHVPLRWVGVEA